MGYKQKREGDRMRILMDMTLPARTRGGTYVYSTQLLDALRGRSDIEMLATEVPRRFHGRGLLYRVANAIETTIWVQHGLVRALKRSVADICHIPSYVAPFNSPCPLVITVYDLTFRTSPHDPLWGLYSRVVAERAIREAAAVITLSRSARAEIVATYPCAAYKVAVIPPGLGASWFEREEPSTVLNVWNQLGVRPPYILSVASQDWRKNLRTLVTAFDNLWHLRGGSVQLVLVGGRGQSTQRLAEQISSLPSRTSILCLGYVPIADLRCLYQGASLFVYPSLQEGFGLPILEAMASGVPVITSSVSAMPETSGGHAVLVDPLDVPALTEAMRTVLEDKQLRRRLSEGAREYARSFSWERTAQLTVDTYRALLMGDLGSRL